MSTWPSFLLPVLRNTRACTETDPSTDEKMYYMRRNPGASIHGPLPFHLQGKIYAHRLTPMSLIRPQSQEVPSAQCAFFGTNCKDIMIVPVPIHCDAFEQSTALDVDFRVYVNIAVPWATIAYDISQFMIEVQDCPTENGTESPWTFTIFFSHHCLDSQNALIRSIPGGEYLDIGGAVLVVKSLHSGRIEHVLPSDIPFIEQMLISTLTSRLRRAKMRLSHGQPHLSRIVFPLPIVAPRQKRPQPSRTIASEAPHPSAYCMFMPSPTDDLAPQGTPESHTSHVDPVHPTHILPGYDVYHIEDILIEIMCHCNWKTVMALSRVASTGRVAARSRVQAILRHALRPYIGATPDTFHSLMGELALSGGGIGGSVARWVLDTNSEYTTTHKFRVSRRCGDLNIIVPLGGLPVMRKHMSALGYRIWRTERVTAPMAMTVERVVSSCRIASGSIGSVKVTIVESTSSVMQALLGSPLASQTNFISPTTVYCFYPNLIGEIATIRTDLPQYRTQPRFCAPYTVDNDNSAWTRPCGPCCPSMPRTTASDRGLATFRWNIAIEKPRSTRKGADHLLGDSVIAWRLTSYCRNAHCKRFVPKPNHGRIEF
ncbi:hypothetical protein NMY22_g14831 [Coprinellus aureogranulatus]|nr:hypothetical protein NMY22_g14831 [Coprinellus aureogranulatus]